MTSDIQYILSVLMGLFIINYAPNINFLSTFYHKVIFILKNHIEKDFFNLFYFKKIKDIEINNLYKDLYEV